MTDQVYRKGAPVEIDVNRIINAIGIPAEGTVISHGDIERATGLRRSDSRYKSVVAEWRRRMLRDHNILLVGQSGKGLLAADPGDRVRWASGRTEAGKRAILRAAHVASTTDVSRLDGVQRAMLDHMQMLASRVVEKTAPTIAPPQPVKGALGYA